MFPSLVPVVAGGRAPYIPPMLIETEATPNPASLKFLPGRAVMGSGGTREFATPEAADASPLAQALFDTGEVTGVFFGADFLTVTPGIRFADSAADDQTRVMTPEKAKNGGSDFIVVGRPITQAADPVAAYRRCVREFIG